MRKGYVLDAMPTSRRHLAVAQDAQPQSASDPEEELLRVGDLAKATGKTVRALHLYENLGLLTPYERSGPGRYRQFSADSLSRVRWISKLQSMGLSLSEIQDIARQAEAAHSAQLAARTLRDVYTAKLAETRAKVKELVELENELEASLRFLELCSHSCDPHADTESCDCCDRHSQAAIAPELIAGARFHREMQ